MFKLFEYLFTGKHTAVVGVFAISNFLNFQFNFFFYIWEYYRSDLSIY